METQKSYVIVPQDQLLNTHPERKAITIDYAGNSYKFQYEFESVNSNYVFYIWNSEKYLFPLLPLSFFMIRVHDSGSWHMLYTQTAQNYIDSLLTILGQEILKKNDLNK